MSDIKKEDNIENKLNNESIEKNTENKENGENNAKGNNMGGKINLENAQIDKYSTGKKNMNKYREIKNKDYINENKISKKNSDNKHSEQENKFDII